MSAKEYAELRHFSRLEAIGYERFDLHAVYGSQVPVKVTDFRFEPEPEQSEEDMFLAAESTVG